MASAASLLHRLESVRERVLDAIFTPRCVECDNEGAYVCRACLDRVEPLSGSFEVGDEATSIQAYSVYPLDGVVRQAVHHLKYQGVMALAGPMGKMMAPRLADLPPSTVIVPVPLHGSRLRHRGYNHAELLAREIGRRTSLSTSTRLLHRTRATPPQAQAKSIDERRSAVRGAFCAESTAAGSNVLLVDDVCTTGSTLAACAEALRQAGAAQISALTFAREL